ncbi:MAG: radical SAM protein [archaeon]
MEKRVAKNYGDFKIAWHVEKLKALLEGRTIAPIYVRVKPTNLCNHRCFYCTYTDRENKTDSSFSGIHEKAKILDQIPYEKMMEILDDFNSMGIKAITFSGGGEPLVYPHIVEVLKKTIEYGIDLSIITNGQNLSGEKAELLKDAKWVRISADYCDAKTFANIRKIPEEKFYEVKNNIQNFAKIKSPDCVLGVNLVISEINQDRIYDGIKFFKELGVDHVKVAPVWMKGFEDYHNLFKEKVIKQIKKAKQDLISDSFAIHDNYESYFEVEGTTKRTYSKCYVMQTIPVIGADQGVYFCHNKAYSKDGKLGSIKDQSFKRLWFSDESKKIFCSFNPKESCNHECANDRKNIAIGNMLSSHGDHINFV